MSRSALPVLVPPRRDWALPAGLLVAAFLLLVGGNLAGNGAFAPIVPDAELALPGWEHGSLLRVLALWIARWPGLDSGTALLLVYVVVATMGAMLAYRFLRVSDWPAWRALLAVALVASHGMLIYAVTTTSVEFLLLLAAAALIPAQRRLEAVGDVQSIINYGLSLPLLLLAGPPLAALIPLMVLAVPFREAEARQKPEVFAAMLLVALAPTLIVIAGVWAMAARAGIGIDILARPFVTLFAPAGQPLLPMLLLLGAAAPVAVLLLHAAIPDRRRKLLTTAVVLAVPLYLAVGNSLFDWRLAPWTPAAALMTTTLGWLCSTRIRRWMQWLVLALLLVSSVASWLLASAWADPAWLDGLWPIQFFGLHTAGLG